MLGNKRTLISYQIVYNTRKVQTSINLIIIILPLHIKMSCASKISFAETFFFLFRMHT